MKHNILLIDDNIAYRRSKTDFLEDEGFFVRAVESGDEGIALIRQHVFPFSLALVDYHMPDMKGPQTIQKIRELDPNITILALSGDDSVEAHNESLESGAVFFVGKDVSEAKFLGILHRACREIERRLKPVVIAPHNEKQKLIASVGMVGVSEAMAEVANLILKFAPSSDSVFIRGENGTGKERVARGARFGAIRPVISVHSDRLIRSKPTGYFGAIRPVIHT